MLTSPGMTVSDSGTDTPRARRFERDGFLPVEGLLRLPEIEECRAVFRPQAMVELERARGFDHGREAPGRENRNPLTR